METTHSGTKQTIDSRSLSPKVPQNLQKDNAEHTMSKSTSQHTDGTIAMFGTLENVKCNSNTISRITVLYADKMKIIKEKKRSAHI